MEISEALEFVGENHRGILSVFKRDGGVAMSPVSVAAHPDGHVEISSRETAYKVRNLRRDPRASLCVVSDGWYGRWIQIDGTAEIQSLPDAMEGLVEYYRRVAGEHPDWDDYRAAMERDRRLLIRIRPERAGPTRMG